MKRDMELIRKLLFFFEEKIDGVVVKVPPIEGYDERNIRYHCVLLHDAGLLRCEPVTSSTSDRVIYVLPFELTWAGHEFLDKVRSEFIWNKMKSETKDRSLSLSFGIINEMAQRFILAALSGS